MKKFFTTMLLVLAAIMGMQAENVWVLGTVGDQTWDPSVGTKMDSVDIDTYELTTPIYSNSYFSFTTALAATSNDWDAIRPYRFGASSNDFEITETLLGEPIQCGELGESADNAFLITSAAMYKITLLLSDRLVMFEKVGDVEEKPDTAIVDGNIYILGEVNGGSWVTNAGFKMTEGANNTFTANVAIPDSVAQAYFGFSKALSVTKADSWALIAPYRFAAVDNESQQALIGEPNALSEEGAGDNSFWLPGGSYIFTLDMNARTLLITADEAKHMYIIGNDPFGNWTPESGMVMNEAEEGVFTATATIPGDVWFIFSSTNAGWDAVNEYRYGPESTEEDQVVEIGEEVTTQLSTSNKSYQVTGDGSEYVITFDMNNLKFKFEKAGNAIIGDVNGDEHVDVNDINIIVNIMLGKDSADNYDGRANVDGEGEVDVADINAIINAMLGK